MGQGLSDLFVDPESLPGGACFSPTCSGFFTMDPDTGENTTQCRYPPSGWEDNWTFFDQERLDHPGLFPDCHELEWFGFIQVIFLAGVYGMVLSWASDMISNGSEMLLLVPAYRGIVGSVVLPVLGAVPDGAIILFSGLGSDAKNQIVVGVGALAGSTIMLITLPWFIAVTAGKVPVAHAPDGSTKTVYVTKFRERVAQHNRDHPPKSILPASLHTFGVKTNRDTRVSGLIMLGTALLYLVIQIPAFVAFGDLEHGMEDKSRADVVRLEHPWFALGFVLCFIAFFAYLHWCVRTSQDNENAASRIDATVARAIERGRITLRGAFFNDIQEVMSRRDSFSDARGATTDGTPLMASTQEESQMDRATGRLHRFLRAKFARYDTDHSGTIDGSELHSLFSDLGEPDRAFPMFRAAIDKDKDGHVSLQEFIDHMTGYISDSVKRSESEQSGQYEGDADADAINYGGEDDAIDNILSMPLDDAGVDDEEEVEDCGLDPATQQWEIKKQAFKMMGIGTIVVLLVSDPAVDVLSSLGSRTGIPAFYIAFVLAPLASNASELIAAYNYALKKTPSSIGVSLATLEGAGIMNNTFCLGIFFLIIFVNDSIAWTFTAETLGILIVEVGVAIIAQKKTMTLFDAYCVVSLYPLSLLFIALLEKYTNLK